MATRHGIPEMQTVEMKWGCNDNLVNPWEVNITSSNPTASSEYMRSFNIPDDMGNGLVEAIARLCLERYVDYLEQKVDILERRELADAPSNSATP
jgi:hypothetical protein